MTEIVLTIEDVHPLELFGEKNSRLNLVKNAFDSVTLTSRGNHVKISGTPQDTQRVKAVIETMIRMLRERHELTNQAVEDIIGGTNPFNTRLSQSEEGGNNSHVITYGRSGKPIKAKTKNQQKLVNLSEENDIVFAIGPAGTGKTYTAVALAVRALKNKVVKKIILTRPAVEAGENLGYLPGDLKDKVDPYLRPLYDALDDMIPAEKLAYFMTTRVIEVAPLAFMRGRTLDNAFIILDEAQNCTTTQIKMFLTRLGPSAKCIITGDPSQIDLPRNQKSGLFRALDILPDINGIARLNLTAEDVVRHRLVKEIIIKYKESDEALQAEYEARKKAESEQQGQSPSPSENKP